MTKTLARFLEKRLVPDLKERARTPSVAEALRHRWTHERAMRRTADEYDTWSARLVEQVGAAWILSCAFVRTLEDRGYLAQRRLAGPGAADSEHYFFELFPQLGARDYLLAVFREMHHLPGAADLFGSDHNAAWRLSPSNPVAQELLDLWRSTTEERAPTRTFEGTDTRFLGDLYQWLSEDARERFALLQTPEFVEKFILKLTLDPAIDEFGLETVRLIDPTCGSGHFLLGAFDRLFELRAAAKPGLDRRAHALAALGQVYGVDLNPYAVAIARFRLTLSFLEKAGIKRIADAPALKTNLAVADSLLHGARSGNRRLSERATDRKDWGDAQFTLEDEPGAERILGQGYHAVVGNPPYITCKDAVLRREYAELYESCAMNYALAVPFTQRFFELGTPDAFVGMINANSFMKREFGKQLIERVLPRWRLTKVIDTAGAYIPGHGTPTVVIFGRNMPSEADDEVIGVLGKRGEPSTPDDPRTGKVWSTVENHFAEIGFEDEFISVAKVRRLTLNRHPWSLSGGGAADLRKQLEDRAGRCLSDVIDDIGFSVIVGEDEAFLRPAQSRWANSISRPLVTGEGIRDWGLSFDEVLLFPLAGPDFEPRGDPHIVRELWPVRRLLEERVVSGSTTMKQSGRAWFDLRRFSRDKNRIPCSIAFAEVATHNHFVLERGGKIFKQTAPVIKLPVGATEDDHLALIGYLNSSVATFYLRQTAHNKGAQGVNEGHKSEAWEQFIQRNGAAVSKMPVIASNSSILRLARALDSVSVEIRGLHPAAVLNEGVALRDALRSAKSRRDKCLARMVALQEELDWAIYDACGLLGAEAGSVWTVWERARPELDHTGLSPGHRPFEVILARDCTEAGLQTAWFERNGYVSPHEIPSCYPQVVCELIDNLVSIIGRTPLIELLERPEYKRRWTVRDYDAEAKAAAAEALLQALENEIASGVAPVRARSAAETVLRSSDKREIAEVLFGSGEDLVDRMAALGLEDHVPFTSALRFTPAGLEKRVLWERTWDLQRREDAGETLEIPIPPKYESKDYTSQTFWRLRGKLDLSKERFISYPGAERDEDKSPLIGWAGWDHLQRTQALAALYDERKTQDGWPKERLVPLLAGVLELVPWVKQWHNEPNAEFGGDRLGDYFERYVTSEASALGVTLDELRAWRPPARQGRRPRNGAAAQARRAGVVGENEPAKPKRGRRRKAAPGEGEAE